MSILHKSFYTPIKGGHAPGDLRDGFLEAVEAFNKWQDGEPEPMIELRTQKFTIRQVCGMLWNCPDIIPGTAWDQVTDPVGERDDSPKRRTATAHC